MDVIGNRSLVDLLDERAGTGGERPALVYQALSGQTHRMSYLQLQEASRRIAAKLQASGLAQGERVFVFLRNCKDYVPVWFGINHAGMVFVPGNIHYSAPEVAFQLGHCEPALVITEPDYLPMIDAICQAMDAPPRVLVVGDVADSGAEALDALPGVAEDYQRPDKLDSHTVAEILYTSGTSSRPKGVVLTHANLLWSGISGVAAFRLQPEDRYFNNKPLFHANCQDTVLSCLTAGAVAVIGERYSATRYIGQLIEHDITICSLSGMLCRTLLNQPPSTDDQRHAVRCAGYALNISKKEIDLFTERFGIPLRNGYGQSESMLYITVQPLSDSATYPSIGLPALEREVFIVDDNNQILPAGEVGELVVRGRRGRNLMLEYYKDDAATEEAFAGGWLHTGDLAYMDKKGLFYFYDRKKDVIKRAGENVSAAEVEEVLMSHPKVVDVAVVGVPDPIRDQAVWAFVVTRAGTLTASALQEFCGAHLAYFKVPENILFLAELPRNASGKVLKRTLIERYADAPRTSESLVR